VILILNHFVTAALLIANQIWSGFDEFMSTKIKINLFMTDTTKLHRVQQSKAMLRGAQAVASMLNR